MHSKGCGRWDLVAHGLSEAARKLEAAGADFIVISANTMHMVVDEVQQAVHIPVLSLLDVVGEAVAGRGFKTVGLLGTRYTMEQAFFHKVLASRSIQTLVPDAEERQYINGVIYNELVMGQFKPEARQGFVKIIQRLATPLVHPKGWARRRRGHPGLHRDSAAGQRSRCRAAAVQHHHPPR